MKGLQFELGLSGRENTYQVAGAVLSSGRTLTERVQALEKDMWEVKKRLEAVETKGKVRSER